MDVLPSAIHLHDVLEKILVDCLWCVMAMRTVEDTTTTISLQARNLLRSYFVALPAYIRQQRVELV